MSMKDAIKAKRMQGANLTIVIQTPDAKNDDEKLGDLAPDPAGGLSTDDMNKDKHLLAGDPMASQMNEKPAMPGMDGSDSYGGTDGKDMELLKSMDGDSGSGKPAFIQKARQMMHDKFKGMKGK